jgi:hypothetical protein
MRLLVREELKIGAAGGEKANSPLAMTKETFLKRRKN